MKRVLAQKMRSLSVCSILACPVSRALHRSDELPVGAFFRTADATGVEKLYLCGITGRPPKKAITKTALGAEETVAWEHRWEPAELAGELRLAGFELAAIETSTHAVDLYDWRPRSPVCLIFGYEVEAAAFPVRFCSSAAR